MRKTKRIIGLLGPTEKAIQIDAILARIGATKSLGTLEGAARGSLFPVCKGGIVNENHIRKLSSRLNIQIPVGKYTGKAVESQAEADEFFSSIVKTYAGEAWEAEYFLDTDFFRNSDGMYSIVAEGKNSANLKRRLGEDYIELAILVDNEEKPRGVEYSLVLADEAGAALESKVKKVLGQIKKDLTERDR
jgi:hypothetical protein